MIREKYILSKSCREIYLPSKSPHFHFFTSNKITFGGVSYISEYYEIHRPAPPIDRLIFTVKGKGRLFSGDSEYSLQPGSLYIAKKNVRHRYILDGEYWEIAWLNLAPDWEIEGIDKKTVMQSSYAQEIENLILMASRESASEKTDSELPLKYLADLLKIYICRDLETSGSTFFKEAYFLFEKLKTRIAANLARNWTTELLKKEAGIYYSDVHFNRLCVKYLGMPGMKYVAAARMREAEKMLACTDYTVGTIAERVGYQNQYAFSTAFKRESGQAPIDFRKETVQSMKVAKYEKQS